MFSFNFRNTAFEKKLNAVSKELAAPAALVSTENPLPGFSWKSFSFEAIIDDFKIVLVDPPKVMEHLKANGKQRTPVLQADNEGSDLIPGVYEGGMKIWESTFDLASYLMSSTGNLFEGKTVLDLGCGSGILGILALQLGSPFVVFQDYNDEVLRYLTIPDTQLNCADCATRTQFWSGDWENFNTACKAQFDIILTSETTYNPANHSKLHDVLRTKLKPEGVIYVAGKSYYFGVGGSIEGFTRVVEYGKVFNCATVWTSNEGVKREILQLNYRKR